jgi:geranylgeranyl diphosphate synthase type I
MIDKNTAALMAASLKAGAMAGCDNAALIEKFHGLGMALGLAFQIRDDILGIWGSSEATGKSTSSDIAKKKKTLPIVHLFAAASPPARKTLASIYADEGIEDGDIETVLKLLDEAGSRAYAEGLVEQYGNACHEIIESLAMDDYYRRDLHELTGFLSRRDR